MHQKKKTDLSLLANRNCSVVHVNLTRGQEVKSTRSRQLTWLSQGSSQNWDNQSIDQLICYELVWERASQGIHVQIASWQREKLPPVPLADHFHAHTNSSGAVLWLEYLWPLNAMPLFIREYSPLNFFIVWIGLLEYLTAFQCLCLSTTRISAGNTPMSD